MGEWFRAGGWGMYPIVVAGVVSLVVAVRALRTPTPGRIAALRNLPTVIVTLALMTFGTNLWAVATHLSDDAFVKARGWSGDQIPVIGFVDLGESAQALTLGGLLAFFVVLLRMFAEVKLARAAGKAA